MTLEALAGFNQFMSWYTSLLTMAGLATLLLYMNRFSAPQGKHAVGYVTGVTTVDKIERKLARERKKNAIS